MAQIPPALQPLLGSDLTAVTAEKLERLIGVEEGQFLDAEQEVSSKGDRRDLAVDVTALANGGGGLLVVGVGETSGTGTLADIVGVPSGGHDAALRVEQVLADLVQPPLPVSVHRVPLAEDRVAILVAVEGGPLRPHAVVDGTSRL